MVESTNDEGNDEKEDDGTTCKICNIPWMELTEKCGDWVLCDLCDEYIHPKCYGKRDISADDDFFVVFKVIFPFKFHSGDRITPIISIN